MASASDVSDLSGMSDFDDIQSAIDEAVGNTSAPKIITGKKGRPASGSLPSTLPQGRAAVNSAFIAAETARRRAGTSAEADRPDKSADLSPTAMGQWSSQQARNRRRILIASLVTIVLVALTVGLVFSFGGKRGGNPVAVNPNENPAENPANPNAVVDDPETTAPDHNVENPASDPPKNDDLQTSNTDDSNNTPPPIPPIEIQQAPATANQGPAPIPGLENPIADSNSTDPPALPESAMPQSPIMPDDPLKRNFGAGVQSGLTPDAMQIPDALGELGSLLQQHGTSVTAMENAAATTFQDTTAGVPAYFFARPESVTIKVADSMAIPAAKISYTQVPLSVVLIELSQLGGLPIAWDGRAVLDAGIDPRSLVDIDIVGGTLGDALNAAANKAEAELLTYEWGLGLVPKGDKEIVTKSVSIVRGNTVDPNRIGGLVAEIPKLFAPGSWEAAEGGFGIKVEGDTLEVSHNQRTVRQITSVIDQLNLLIDDSSLEVATHAEIANESLDRKIELPATIDMTIGEFLVRVEKKLGITILVDWSMVTGSGWNLNTVVPGNFSAEDNRQLLNRLARAMDLQWYSVGPSTFILTTPLAASATINVEIYPVGILLDGQITQEHLMEVLRRSAGASLSSEIFTNVYFDGESKSFLVAAPPFVQEKVASVLGELKTAVQTKASTLPESPIGK